MELTFIIGLFFVLAAVVGIAYMNKNPDLSFWLVLNMYFDPGGYLTIATGPFLGRLDYRDILIIIISLSLFRIRGLKHIINSDGRFVKFTKYLLYFTIYYFIIYGGIIPYIKDDFNYAVFLMKSRRYLYGIIILYSVYVYSLRSVKYFYLTSLFVGLITMLLFWFSLASSISLMEYVEMDRYGENSMIRLGMSSYGLFQILFPIATIVFLFRDNQNLIIKHKNYLYFAGIMVLASLLVSLTRRTIIDVIASVLILSILVSSISRKPIFNKFLKIFIPTLILVFGLLIIKPKYINYIKRVTTDTFLLITRGEDTRGVSEDRLTGEGIYPEVFKTVKENIYFGTGYSYVHWDNVSGKGGRKLAVSTRGFEFGQLADAAAEIGFLNMLFSLGVIGFLFLLPLYISIYKLARILFRIARYNYNKLVVYDSLILVFSVWFILLAIKLFTYKIWSTGDEFIGIRFQINAVWFGLGFAFFQSNINRINDNNKV